MSARIIGLALAAMPSLIAAQQTPHPDTTRKRRAEPVPLHEITVTAAPARRDEAAGSVSLTPAILRRVPALNPYDLLRQTAGLEVHDQGQGPGFASNAAIRGFSSDHSTDMALWIDGVPINEPVNGHAEGYNDWSLLLPQAVRTIDVFKGPTSALYGNFALAGVVSVRTAERMRGTAASLSGGAYGRVEAALLTGFDREAAGGVFGARGLREDGWRPNSGYRLGQAHARVVRNVSSSATVDAGLELYAAGWSSPGFLTLDQFAGREYDHVSDPTDGGFKHRAQERVSLRVIASPAVIWRSTLYATQGRWQLFLTTPPEGGTTEGSGSQLEEEDRRYGFGATSALTWVLPRGEVTVGTEGRWDHSNYENWFTTRRQRDSSQVLAHARQMTGALFLQSTERVGQRLRLHLGGRFDILDTRSSPAGEAVTGAHRGVLSPKLGASMQLFQPVELYTNVSRGFRQTDGVITDPALPFITAWAYESGVKLDISRVTASAALFRMEVSNEQTFDPLTARSSSGGASRRQGVELGLRLPLGAAVSLDGDWTFTDARYRRLITEDGDTLSGARVFNTAKYAGSVGLDLAPSPARWRLRASSNVVGPYTPFEAPGVTLPAYALFHLSGEVRLGRAGLQLGIRNLFNRQFAELRAAEFVVPGQPRSVFAGLRYGLNE